MEEKPVEGENFNLKQKKITGFEEKIIIIIHQLDI